VKKKAMLPVLANAAARTETCSAVSANVPGDGTVARPRLGGTGDEQQVASDVRERRVVGEKTAWDP
jgi:hypothetical protein